MANGSSRIDTSLATVPYGSYVVRSCMHVAQILMLLVGWGLALKNALVDEVCSVVH
jgi:hypothetical protein